MQWRSFGHTLAATTAAAAAVKKKYIRIKFFFSSQNNVKVVWATWTVSHQIKQIKLKITVRTTLGTNMKALCSYLKKENVSLVLQFKGHVSHIYK